MEYKELSPAAASEEQLRLLIANQVASNSKELPAERMLVEQLGVSRTTLRKSLETLEKEGLIQKNGRKGMEINQKKRINMLAMNSMSEQLKTPEQTQSIFVLASEITAGVAEVNLFLKRAPEAHLFRLVRKRLMDDTPVMYEILYLNPDRFKGINDIDFTDQSLYQVLAEQFDVFPSYGREEIRFAKATKEQADLLAIPLDQPLFEVVSKAFDQEDEPVEYSIQFLIGNQVAYKIRAQNIFDYREDEDN